MESRKSSITLMQRNTRKKIWLSDKNTRQNVAKQVDEMFLIKETKEKVQ